MCDLRGFRIKNLFDSGRLCPILILNVRKSSEKTGLTSMVKGNYAFSLA